MDQQIATYLTQKKYLLTALEFMTELQEDGIVLPELKEYFANSNNFLQSQQQQKLQHQRQVSEISANDVDTLSEGSLRVEQELKQQKQLVQELQQQLAQLQPISSQTRRYDDDKLLNGIVHQYLVQNGYSSPFTGVQDSDGLTLQQLLKHYQLKQEDVLSSTVQPTRKQSVVSDLVTVSQPDIDIQLPEVTISQPDISQPQEHSPQLSIEQTLDQGLVGEVSSKSLAKQSLTDLLLQNYRQVHKRYVEDVDVQIDNLVPIIAQQLPLVVPSVVTNKRPELLKIIVSAIQCAEDLEIQQQLVTQLLQLIKKPDVQQRSLVVAYCQMFSKAVQQTVLEECMKDVKYTERRILAADLCAQLVDKETSTALKKQVVDFLMSSFEDTNSMQLRYQALLALIQIQGQGQDLQLFDLFEKLSLDSSQDVGELFLEVLAPSHLSSLSNQRKLQPFVENLMLLVTLKAQAKVQDVCMDARNLLNVTEQHQLAKLIKVVELAVPHLLLECCPKNDIVVEFNFEQLKELKQLQEQILDQSESYVWCSSQFTELLFKLVLELDPVNSVLSYQTCQLARVYFQLFGDKFKEAVIKPHLQQVMEGSSQKLVPVLLCSYVPSFQICTELIEKFVQDLFVKMATEQHGWTLQGMKVLRLSMGQLCQYNKKFVEPLLQIQIGMLTNEKVECRMQIAATLQILIPHVNLHTATSRLIPAMIKLSNDSDKQVRLLSLAPYATLLEIGGKNQEILEKLEIQLASFLSDPHIQMQLDILKVFSVTLLYLDESFRENFLLPAMSRWCQSEMIARRPTSKDDRESKTKQCLAALQVYQSFSGLVGSDTAVQNYVLPSLKLIKNELPLLTDEHSNESDFSKNLDNMLIWIHRLMAEFQKISLDPELMTHEISQFKLKAFQALDSSDSTRGNLLSSLIPGKRLATPPVQKTDGELLSNSKRGSFFTSKLFSKISSALTETVLSPEITRKFTEEQRLKTKSPIPEQQQSRSRAQSNFQLQPQAQLSSKVDKSQDSVTSSTQGVKSMLSLNVPDQSNQSTIQKSEGVHVLETIHKVSQPVAQLPGQNKLQNFFDIEDTEPQSISSPLTQAVLQLAKDKSDKDFVIDTVYQPKAQDITKTDQI